MLTHRIVNPRSPLHKLVLALGFLAVLAAQLFGIGSSFLCDCSGSPKPTASDHCHGPHDAHCHENAAPAHSGESCPDDGDKQTHELVVQVFQSLESHTAPLVLPAPVMLELLSLDGTEWAHTVTVATLENATDLGESPPSGVAVARTIVLLI